MDDRQKAARPIELFAETPGAENWTAAATDYPAPAGGISDWAGGVDDGSGLPPVVAYGLGGRPRPADRPDSADGDVSGAR